MKYNDFKRYKFSTVFKNINFKKYNFFKINKHFNLKSYKFDKYFDLKSYKFDKYLDLKSYKFDKYFNLKRYNFLKISTNINLRSFNFNKYFKLARYAFFKILRSFNFKIYKKFIIYILGFSIISALFYLSTPLFYRYDKTSIENLICKDFNLKCSINGKIKYSFFPSPRIIINQLVVNNLNDEKTELGFVKNLEVTVSITSLFNKQGFTYKKKIFNDAKFNLNLEKINLYKNITKKSFNLTPLNFTNSRINFYEGENYISSIQNINFKLKSNLNTSEGILKGSFLDDNLYINFKSNRIKIDTKTILTIKLLESKIFTKINIITPKSKKIHSSGSFLLKKNKNTLKTNFDYKNNKIVIKEGNIRNNFLNGKLDGVVSFLPYFDFDLNIVIDNLNFNKFYTFIVNLSEINKKNLFHINKKINGQFNLSVDKIFSKNTLINSLESRLKFFNGNILVDQLLFNMRKLGAADISGVIKNEKKFTNFIFDSNIFVDNLKRFNNKFGVFNQEDKPHGLFISGKLNLTNLNLTINEISDENQFNEEDITYFEKEFNNLVLEDGYSGLLSFSNFKKFIKSALTVTN